MKKLVGGFVLLVVLMLGGFYFFGAIKPERPTLASQPLDLPRYESSIDVPVSIALETLQEMVETAAPTSLQGTEHPNVPGNIDRERLNWSARRGAIALSSGNGALVVTTSLTGGATLHARACPVGRLINLTCATFQESADLAARVKATVSNVHLTPDWKLSATLTPEIDVTEATSRVFGFIRVSFRDKLQDGIGEAIPKVQGAFGSFLDQLNIKQELERVWAETDHILKVYDDPTVWIVLEPKAVALAPVSVGDGKLSTALRLVANVKTVIGAKPEDKKGAIPATLADMQEAPPAFDLKVPLLLPLSEIASQANKCCTPFSVPVGSKTVELSDIRLSEGGGKLIVEVKFRSGWFGLRGKAYLEGTPALSADKNRLSVENLDFDVRTKERLADGAAELLKPVVLSKIAEALKVDLKPYYEAGLGEIRDRLMALSMGERVAVNSDIQSVNVEDVFVGDGKLVIVAAAKGSVTVIVP